MIELVGEERLRRLAVLVCAKMGRAPSHRIGTPQEPKPSPRELELVYQGARAALAEVGVVLVLEVDLEKPWLCPLVENARYDDDVDECGCWAVERHDMPTSCPKVVHKHGEPLKLLAPDKCPLRNGSILVRAKGKP